MPQAKRIKKKPAKKTKTKVARKPRNIPWGLLLVVLISGVVLGKLISGAQNDGNGLGSGLRALFSTDSEPIDDDQAIAELVDKSTETEFEFYSVLPDIEQVMPDDLPEAAPSRPDANLDYYVQAASFRNQSDAEKLRARIALKGFKSITQARTSEETGTFFRVRLGPYSNRRKAKTVKNKLQKIGVRPMLYSSKKN